MIDGIVNQQPKNQRIAKMSDDDIFAIPESALNRTEYGRDRFYRCIYCSEIFKYQQWAEIDQHNDIFECPKCKNISKLK